MARISNQAGKAVWCRVGQVWLQLLASATSSPALSNRCAACMFSTHRIARKHARMLLQHI